MTTIQFLEEKIDIVKLSQSLVNDYQTKVRGLYDHKSVLVLTFFKQTRQASTSFKIALRSGFEKTKKLQF
jgi:hypothetical protein